LSLTTGKKISRQQWDELLIPDGIIGRVEAMATAQRQPIMENGGPVFEWSPGIAIVEENEEVIFVDEQGGDEIIENEHGDVLVEANDVEMDEDEEADLEDEEGRDQRRRRL